LLVIILTNTWVWRCYTQSQRSSKYNSS